MSKDEIIKLAREAKIECDLIDEDEGQVWYITTETLERFAALVAAAEREACAQIVEASPSYDWHRFACEAAAAIRARGEK